MRLGNDFLSRMPGSPSLLAKESFGLKNGGDLSTKEPVQVEPKSYFANERTFIQWISAALLLLTVSSIMMGSGSFNGTSSVIAFSSLVLVTYASLVYFRRVRLLQSGTSYGYLDFIGPSILAVGVGLGVFLILADSIKGSEFLPWGSAADKENHRLYDRRVLTSSIVGLQEVEGQCSPYSIEGINMLEYLPKDILLRQQELVVATPQSLVSHPLFGDQESVVIAQFPDVAIQSITTVDSRVFALSTGPSKTELLEITANVIESRFLIRDAVTTNGSMVFVPSSKPGNDGKLYIYLDGTMYSYHVPSMEDVTLTRVSTINMKVLNGGQQDEDNPITAMAHFDGVTYFLREKQNIIEGWDLNRASLITIMSLPTISENDKWVGMAFQRDDKEQSSPILGTTKNQATARSSSTVSLHMPLDSFPPQLWSFQLDENARSIFSFPNCQDMKMN